MTLNIVLLVAGMVCVLNSIGFMLYSPRANTTKGAFCFVGGAVGHLAGLIIMGIAVTTKL